MYESTSPHSTFGATASIERLADTIGEFMDTEKLMAILEGKA